MDQATAMDRLYEARERIAFLEAERSWLRRKLGRALKYIEDRDGSALAYSFAKHTRELRPDLPTWDGDEKTST